MVNRCPYGMVTRMIAQAMAEDASLTIEQLHVITGAKRDAIYKAVQRNPSITRRNEPIPRGGVRMVCWCQRVDVLNEWLLKGMLNHGGETTE